MDIFASIFDSGLTAVTFLEMFLAAIIMGVVIAFVSKYKSNSSKGFFITLSILPICVAMVICLVSGNIGAGIAVAGAFALIKFRSVQGKAQEIVSIFIAMAMGLAFGLGYIAYGVIFGLIAGIFMMILSKLHIFDKKIETNEKLIKITIPEDVDYAVAFEDVMNKYTQSHEIVKAKLTNLGSMYKVHFKIKLKDVNEQKKFLDEIRIINKNLEIKIESPALDKLSL